MNHFRPRNILLVGGSLLVFLFLWYSDPNGGALTTTLVAQLATPVIAVWFAHLARRALFDYIDMKELYEKSKKSPLGASIAFAGVCVVIYALLGLFGNQVKAQPVATYIPQQAVQLMPLVKGEQQTHWVDHPKPGYYQV